MRDKAIVLLSGGLDSATVLFIALHRGFDVIPLHVQYGQRHNRELEGARKIVAYCCNADRELDPRCHPLVEGAILFPRFIKGSSLTDTSIPVATSCMPWNGEANDKPLTYVPARNLMLLSMAASLAEQENASIIFTGFNVIDYSGYPDCRPVFVEAMQNALTYGMQRGVKIEAPIIHDTKVEIVRKAMELYVPLRDTWSCYNPKANYEDKVREARGSAHPGWVPEHNIAEVPCGECDSCRIRAAAFRDLGEIDPALKVQ